jgi:uncharacterized LabA/DUF88 family protein
MQARLAVLVDAENISAKHWPKIRERVETLGTTIVCRIFGNLLEPRLAAWAKIAEEEALQPILQFSGPNACDIALTISAMDLLHGSKLEGVCLVSSDGDFTPLVHRLKAAGLKVYGFGSVKSSPSLAKACSGFTTLSDLTKPPVVVKPAPVKKAA